MKKLYLCKLSAILLAASCVAGIICAPEIQGIAVNAAKKNTISFSKSVKILEKGNTYQFKVKGIKNDGKAVTWSSSDTSVAKVSKKGRVTAIKKGTVKITAVVKKDGTSISKKLKVIKATAQDQNTSNKDTENKNIENDQELPIYDIGEIISSGDGETDSVYKNLEVENAQVENLSSTVEKTDTGVEDIGFMENKDMNGFCYSVFEKAVAASLENKESNPVVSPLSAYFALSLVAEGADGDTKTQFDALLGNSMRRTRIGQLMLSLQDVSGSTKLSIADSVWLDDDFEANASWLSKMVNSYQAEVYRAGLSTDAARVSMNNWISNRTNGMIPSLFNKNLSEESRLVLMNTIYLKAKWQKTFQEGATYPREFTNENGETIKTDFLNRYESNYNYFETEEADGVILPYDDGNLCMIAIRPQNGQTARQLAQSLTAETVTSYLTDAESTYMNLHLPKFTIGYSLQMNDVLKKLGLTDAFDGEKADLSALGTGTKETDGNLFISDVLQKVKVVVDEEGTEAAAVTAVISETTSALIDENQPLEVDFNEPFVYAIVASKTPFGEKNKEHVPLFLGVVTDLSGELSD